MKPNYDAEAQVVNTSPPVNGVETWMCNTCGIKWDEPQNLEFNRQDDRTNWPVFCEECSTKFAEEIKKQ